jgi:hypothetical protein
VALGEVVEGGDGTWGQRRRWRWGPVAAAVGRDTQSPDGGGGGLKRASRGNEPMRAVRCAHKILIPVGQVRG